MFEFKICLAQKTVLLKSRFNFLQTFCKDYLFPFEGAPDIIAEVKKEDVEKEIEIAEVETTEEYAECLCLYREIAEKLPEFDRLVMHGAAITHENRAVLFTAPSGTGKTTHIKLWKKAFGSKVDIINGDKPILHIQNDGVIVHSSPWAGKENYQKNRNAPLKAICIIKRAEKNRTYKVDPKEHLPFILHQIYLPKNGEMAQKTLQLFNSIISQIPVYIVECNISENAATAAYNAVFGE